MKNCSQDLQSKPQFKLNKVMNRQTFGLGDVSFRVIILFTRNKFIHTASSIIMEHNPFSVEDIINKIYNLNLSTVYLFVVICTSIDFVRFGLTGYLRLPSYWSPMISVTFCCITPSFLLMFLIGRLLK